MLYVLRMANTDYVKVGYAEATDVHARRTHLQPGCPFELRLELTLPGGKHEEAALHKRLEQRHVRGEWFKLTVQDVRDLIGVMPDAPGYSGPPLPGNEPDFAVPPAQQQALDAAHEVLAVNRVLAQYPDAQAQMFQSAKTLVSVISACFDLGVRARQAAAIVERHQMWERARDAHDVWRRAQGQSIVPIRRVRLVTAQVERAEIECGLSAQSFDEGRPS